MDHAKAGRLIWDGSAVASQRPWAVRHVSAGSLRTNVWAWTQDRSSSAGSRCGWIVGADGSGLRKFDGRSVRWSPTARGSSSRLACLTMRGSGLGDLGNERRWLRTPPGSPRRTRPRLVAGWRPRRIPERRSLDVADLDGTHVRALGTLGPPHRPTPMVWIPTAIGIRRGAPNGDPGRERSRPVRLRDRGARCRGGSPLRLAGTARDRRNISEGRSGVAS
jgi:hypothetical protein